MQMQLGFLSPWIVDDESIVAASTGKLQFLISHATFTNAAATYEMKSLHSLSLLMSHERVTKNNFPVPPEVTQEANMNIPQEKPIPRYRGYINWL